MAGRALLGLYRDINPHMLRKKDRVIFFCNLFLLNLFTNSLFLG
jgi:hypothetical protein